MTVRAENIRMDFIREGKGTNVFTAVSTCNIELSAGTFTVIKGRSGGGKSTLINIMAGLLAPTGGSVFYDENDIYSIDDGKLSEFRNRHIGYVPQGKSAIASLNVLENVLLPEMLYGSRDDERAYYLMEQFGIAGLSTAMPSELSGGELRRMAIARALIRKPDVLFADEPTGDLDDENTLTVLSSLRKAADDGCTVLMVTHEQEAEEYADNLFRMDAGVLRKC